MQDSTRFLGCIVAGFTESMPWYGPPGRLTINHNREGSHLISISANQLRRRKPFLLWPRTDRGLRCGALFPLRLITQPKGQQSVTANLFITPGCFASAAVLV